MAICAQMSQVAFFSCLGPHHRVPRLQLSSLKASQSNRQGSTCSFSPTSGSQWIKLSAVKFRIPVSPLTSALQAAVWLEAQAHSSAPDLQPSLGNRRRNRGKTQQKLSMGGGGLLL